MIVESRLFFSTLGLNRRAKVTTSSRGENLTLERARECLRYRLGHLQEKILKVKFGGRGGNHDARANAYDIVSGRAARQIFKLVHGLYHAIIVSIKIEQAAADLSLDCLRLDLLYPLTGCPAAVGTITLWFL